MQKQVVSEIANNNLCIGCGVCAGVCPSNLLAMYWCANGDLAVEFDGKCPPSCDLCLRVCPFVDGNHNEDCLSSMRFDGANLEKNDQLGLYIDTYVGFSSDEVQRKKSASGGVITALLKQLLESKIITSVICVGAGSANGRLFEFVEITESSCLDQCASSKYYPVDVEVVVRKLQEKNSDERVAITGLPCTLKSLTLAMELLPRLNNQIKFMIGLVCGELPNSYYTDYLSSLSIGDKCKYENVNYRSKEGTLVASNYNYIAYKEGGESGLPLPFFSVVSVPYTYGMFQHNCCNYCDDVFAEVADITVMDAWLSEYTKDHKGTSLIVSRSSELNGILQKMKTDGMLYIDKISPGQVIESQLGVLLKKRKQLGERLYWAMKHGYKVPKKRVEPKRPTWIRNTFIVARLTIQNRSKELWVKDKSTRAIARDPVMVIMMQLLKLENIHIRLTNLMNKPSRLKRYASRYLRLIRN